MESAGKFPVTEAAWDRKFLEEAPGSQLVLEHFDREQTALHRYLIFIGLDSHTAEDVVQESFLKLHEHVQQGGDQSNLRAWLYRVAHNLARNHQTSFRAAKTDLFADVSLATDLRISPSAEDNLLVKERSAALLSAVRLLSPTQRDCLALRAQGLKYREIAETLDLSISAVAENVQRGLESLKELL